MRGASGREAFCREISAVDLVERDQVRARKRKVPRHRNIRDYRVHSVFLQQFFDEHVISCYQSLFRPLELGVFKVRLIAVDFTVILVS